MNWLHYIVLGIFFSATHFYGCSDALNCSQCNMRLRNVMNTCEAPRQMTGCIGCMKTVTKVKLRDSGYHTGWERISNVTSRFCMTVGTRSTLKPEGCYKQQNNGGYTERCYCYTDWCNSGASKPTMNFLSFSSTSSSLTTIMIVTATFLIGLTFGYGGSEYMQ